MPSEPTDAWIVDVDTTRLYPLVMTDIAELWKITIYNEFKLPGGMLCVWFAGGWMNGLGHHSVFIPCFAPGEATADFPLKSDAVKIADAMWDYGCGFQANLSAEGVFWGNCFGWNSSFEWEWLGSTKLENHPGGQRTEYSSDHEPRI